MYNKTLILAEVKLRAKDWVSPYSFEYLARIADAIGDEVAFHTEELWGGSIENAKKIRKYTKKRLVAKGVHKSDDTIERLIDLGVDSVLVVGRIPKKYPERCLIEPYTLDELLELPEEHRLVWNSRDLRAFLNGTSPQARERYSEVRALRPRAWLCQASNIRSVDDIHPGADAVLVGTHLVEFAASLMRR